MSAAGETEKVAAVTAAKPVKEKKSKENKPKSVKTASHPPYFQMIKEAVLALKEKGGSSPYAIAKYMEEKHKAVLPANFRKILGLQLKNSASKGKLIKIKASYKLSASAPKSTKPINISKNTKGRKAAKGKANNSMVDVVKKKTTRAARATAATTTSTTTAKPKGKTVMTMKKKKKRATPVKAKAKQPKSIKSPAAAKKAKKAAA